MAKTKAIKTNYAMIGGVRYPIKFEGYDRETYKHERGCLAYDNGPRSSSLAGPPCQCGAMERADKWYSVKVPGQSPSGRGEQNADR